MKYKSIHVTVHSSIWGKMFTILSNSRMDANKIAGFWWGRPSVFNRDEAADEIMLLAREALNRDANASQ